MADEPLHRKQRALLGLWAVPGIGPRTLEIFERVFGDVGQLLDVPVASWVRSLDLPEPVVAELAGIDKLSTLADLTQSRADKGRMQIVYAGEPGFPPRLVGTLDAPPLLFFRGTVNPPRRRLAMVGSRHPDGNYLIFAQRFAEAVARAGLGIVSGAAEGVDRVCHYAALTNKQETWAFLGSALDELDSAQRELQGPVLAQGGSFYSELPPGVRAKRSTFPRRNRLISGAADAVLVMRAGIKSGALFTAQYAVDQGRPLLAMPGEFWNPAVAGCHQLIASGQALACVHLDQVRAAVGASEKGHGEGSVAKVGNPVDLSALSAEAMLAYEVLGRAPLDFENVMMSTRISSGTLSSALCELELMGLVVQHPGKRYERI